MGVDQKMEEEERDQTWAMDDKERSPMDMMYHQKKDLEQQEVGQFLMKMGMFLEKIKDQLLVHY